MGTRHRIALTALALAGCTALMAQSGTLRHKNGDWFVGLGGGFSHSMAENAKADDFITKRRPSLNALLGHNFTPAFGLQLTGAVQSQVSRCSPAMVSAMPETYGAGRYSFNMFSASMSGVFNLTNIFFGYDPERLYTCALTLGGGLIKTFGFDEVVQLWNEQPYYPVNADGGQYIVGHVGTQWAFRLGEPWDLMFDLRVNATDNKYNGVSNGNHLDFYLDFMVNIVFHYKNGKQQLRRFRPPKPAPYVDPIMVDSTGTYRETVRYGEPMRTQIPFYAGFYYLNTVTSKRVALVARFMRENPLLNLTIVGHPDIIPDEDEIYHMDLARRRGEAVRDELVEKHGIDASRLRVITSGHALQSFKTVREWVPSVHFVMEAPD